MLIQDEAPRPAHPLATLDEDYERAVLHLAWDHRLSDGERTLLFGMVELLPVEVPPPLDDGEQHERLGPHGDHRVHLRRFVMPARRALAWHLDCRRGVALLPDEAGRLPGPDGGASTPLALSALGEEPPWPTLVCVSGESDTVPFCPAWHAHARVHHLVPLAPLALDQLWPDEDERRRAAEWLAERLHFSLESYPEYWGSSHLVAPNPVYRSLDTRLLSGTPPRESVLARFRPRAGKSVDGLELLYTDKEPWGPLDVRRVTVRSPLLRLDFEREVQGVKEDVLDPKRGVLAAWHQEAFFFKSARIDVSPGGERGRAEERVRVERSADRAAHEVSPTGPAADGVPHAPPARVRMREAHFTREKHRRADELDQLWFSAQRLEATEALVSRIAGAKREVLIVDPWFGPGELVTFALAASRREVPVHVLSSAGFLRSSTAPGGDVAAGERLLSELDRIASPERTGRIEVRVVRDSSIAGESILLVDDRIWLLSTPLHAFGDRPSLMVALPDPEPLRRHLQAVWSEAAPLRRWLARRGKPRDAGAGDGA